MTEKKHLLSRRDFLRLMAASSAAAALANAPFGLSSASASGLSQQKFLNYWTGWGGFEFDVLQGLVDQFNEEHPDIFVNMTTVFGQYEKVLTAIAGGNPPDVVSAVWLHQLVSMAAQGGLTPVTEYAARDGIDGTGYFEKMWNNWWWNDELWGLMVTGNANLIAYKPDTFAEIGVDKPPETIAELDEIAQALEKVDSDGNIQRVGILPSYLRWWGLVFGGTFYDEENQKITANDPKIVEALEWMNSYRQRLGPDHVAAFMSGYGDYSSPQNAFFVDKEAMTQVGEWFIEFTNRFAPDLNMDMFAAPYPPGGRPHCTTFDGSVFTIPTGVKNPDASWEFIRWLSEDEHMGEFCFKIHNVPPKEAPAMAERFISDPRFLLAINVLNGENAFGPDKIPVNDFYSSRLAEAESSVFAGEISAQEALDRVTEEVQKELEDALERLERQR